MPLSSVCDHVISHVVSLLHILQLFMPFMMQMQHKKTECTINFMNTIKHILLLFPCSNEPYFHTV